MDINAPIATLMTTTLKTVGPDDSVKNVKEIIDEHQIHHVPVVEGNKIVGMISEDDLLHFLKLTDKDSQETYINELRLKNYKCHEIMTDQLVTLSSTASIKSALELFVKNRFHAVPIVDDNKLVGIITTHDIIKDLLTD